MTTLSESTPPLLTPLPDAWKAIGIGRTKLLELIDAGELEAVHVGRRRLVVTESLHEYVERLRASA